MLNIKKQKKKKMENVAQFFYQAACEALKTSEKYSGLRLYKMEEVFHKDKLLHCSNCDKEFHADVDNMELVHIEHYSLQFDEHVVYGAIFIYEVRCPHCGEKHFVAVN